MMKRFNYKMMAMLFLGLIFGSRQGLQAQITFQKTYNGSGNLQGHSVKQTADGGYILAGMTFYNSLSLDDLLLMRLDEHGDTLWCKTYGGPLGEFGNSVTVIQTDDDMDGNADDGFFMTGATKSFGNLGGDFYILKIDANGGIQWENRIEGTGIDHAQASFQTSDGGFVVAGSSNSKSVGSSDYYVVKLDANGALMWDYGIGGNSADHASSIQQTADGGYIITGSTRSFGVAAFNGGYVVKLTAGGLLDWDRVYDHTEFDKFTALDQTSDGGYILVGYVKQTGILNINDISLVKIDNSGNILWSKLYGGIDDEKGVYVEETPDKGFIVGGYTETYGAGDRDLLLIKTDSLGGVDWSKTYGSNDFESTGLWGEFVDQTADGGYVLAGNSDSHTPVTNNLHALYLVKTDSLGNSNCHETTINITTNPVTFNAFVPASARSLSLPYYTQTSTVAQLPIVSIDTLCQYFPPVLNIAEPQTADQSTHQSLYPNPFTDIINIDLNQYQAVVNDELINLSIYDMMGRPVKNISMASTQIVEVNMSELINGFYFYTIRTGETVLETGKIVKK